MKITIEDNELIYIYLSPLEHRKSTPRTIPYVKCFLLFDKNSQWMGLKILSENDEGEYIQLPNINEVSKETGRERILKKEDELEILFDQFLEVDRILEQECNIDILGEYISGIEIILFADNNIGNKDVVKPFLIRDI